MMMSDHYFDSKTITTRKPHHCHGCNRDLPPGSKMLVCEGIQDGEHYRGYWCETCLQIEPQWTGNEDEIPEGGFRDELPEEWEECRKRVEDAKDGDK